MPDFLIQALSRIWRRMATISLLYHRSNRITDGAMANHKREPQIGQLLLATSIFS